MNKLTGKTTKNLSLYLHLNNKIAFSNEKANFLFQFQSIITLDYKGLNFNIVEK